MTRLILVLGDQLSHDLSALREGDPARDIVVMAEVRAEATYVPHHPKKITLFFSAMRHFADALRGDGWQVAYTDYADPDNAGSIPGELLRRASDHGASEVIATQPGEWRVIEALNQTALKVTTLPDDRFICAPSEFASWARGRKALRMEYFYREMRRKTGLLMDGDNPVGGAWNFDAENRKSVPRGLTPPAPLTFAPDQTTLDVMALVGAEFGDHFGALDGFHYAVTRDDALAVLDHFVTHALPQFGDYQDAMQIGQPFLWHAILSPYLNIGLLGPLEICRAVETAWQAGDVPLNAAEGFIRQIIGWREYIRGIYFLKGPDYVQSNVLGHDAALPRAYWGAATRMACLSACVDQTSEHGYAHHIQRLMVLGNFALITGSDPRAVHDWFMGSYVDAGEWVMAANTIGMSQFADGGVVASKPYVSSGNYINKMSDYCKGCHYSVSRKTGQGACPFNLLYWHFLDRHRARFEANPRMANMYRTWDRMDRDRRATVLQEAGQVLDRLRAGDPV